jgi:hypothetical protein
MGWKRVVMFFTGEALFLSSRNYIPVPDEAGGAVMIEC